MAAAKHLVQACADRARAGGVGRLVTADLAVAATAAVVILTVTAADRVANADASVLISLLPG